MLKEPKAGEWWVSNCDGEIIRVAGLDSDGDPVIEHEDSEYDAYAMDTFLAHWHHEPDCNGFDWVKPEPEAFPQYYIHPTGFYDGTAYLMRTSKNNYECVGEDGKSQRFIVWENYCDEYVRDGSWLQVTQAEAEALLDKPVPVESPDDLVI